MNSALDIAMRTTVCVQLRQEKRNLGTLRLALDRTLSSNRTLVWRSSQMRVSRAAHPGEEVNASVTMSRSGARAVGICATLTELEEWSEPPRLMAFDTSTEGILNCAYVRYTVDTMEVAHSRGVHFISAHLILDGALMEHIVFW